MRLVVTDTGAVLNVSHYISVEKCAAAGCSTELIWCDHGSLISTNEMRHPQCVCEEPPLLCLTHKQIGFRCDKCMNGCAGYDCFGEKGTVKCALPACKMLICDECAEMGRTHCEEHREHGG